MNDEEISHMCWSCLLHQVHTERLEDVKPCADCKNKPAAQKGADRLIKHYSKGVELARALDDKMRAEQ